MRSCEPRDLIERARDICRYRGQDFVLSREVLDAAWDGYFGGGDEVVVKGADNEQANGQ